MKKVFKVLPVLTAACASPLLVLLGGCAPSCNKCYREVDFSLEKINNLNDTKQASTNIEKMLLGDKSYHNGNYVIVFGSECSAESNKLFGKYDGEHHYEDYVNTNCMGESKFAEAFETIKTTYYNNLDFGLQLYLDLETLDEAKQDQQDWVEGAVAFDKKWDSQYVSKAQQIYDTREYDVKKTYEKNKSFFDRVRNADYIRTDESAVKMRELVSYIQTLFTASVVPMAADNNLPFAMVWVKGVPQKDQFKQLNGSTCCDDLVNIVKYISEHQNDDNK